MNKEYKKLLPDWYLNEHEMVLSNDIDSLASCALLKKINNWEIKYFYDFEKVYKITGHTEKKEKCWVDVAIQSGHAFDNHVSRLSLYDEWNKDMINLNQTSMITNDNYSDKYAGSTLLEIWSLYDVPLPKTEIGKMILLAIDVSFKGFYSTNFHDIQKYYLVDILGFKELYNVINRHEKEEFYDVITKYGLNADIICEDGELKSRLKLERIGKLLDLDLTLPEEEFEVIEELEIIEEDIQKYHNSLDDVCIDIRTAALTYRNKLRYSKVHRKVGRRASNYLEFLKIIGVKTCTYADE